MEWKDHVCSTDEHWRLYSCSALQREPSASTYMEYSTCWNHKNINVLHPGGWLEPSNYIFFCSGLREIMDVPLGMIETSLPAFSPGSGLLSIAGRTQFCHCGWEKARAAPVKGRGGEWGRSSTQSDSLSLFVVVLSLSEAQLAMEHLAVAFGAFCHKAHITVVFFLRSLSVP